MDFSKIRKEILKLDEGINNLKTIVFAEMTEDVENNELKKLINICVDVEQQINSIKMDIQDSEIEEEEFEREKWEEEQIEIEKYYYNN